LGPVRATAPPAERARAYAEQAIYLSDTGADVLILEHFGAAEEAALALRAVRDASDAPPLALLRFDGAGRTAEGLGAAEAGRALLEAGAEGLGVSCTPGGAALGAIVAALRPLRVPLGVLLSLESAQPAEPDAGEAALHFAESLAALAGQGVAIVGGCCGVLPAHLRAAAQRLGNKEEKTASADDAG
jgi:methionine synthase I (cobalamin-dependent)